LAGCSGSQQAEPAPAPVKEEAADAQPVEETAPAEESAPADKSAPAEAPAPAPESDAATVQVYRDTWGIPHIYADNELDAVYAVGYTQAEDRLDDIYLNLRAGLGTLSEVIGKDGLETDVVIHTTRSPQSSKRNYENASPELQAILQAYLKGVHAYLAEHPEAESPFAFDLEPWHPLTLGRLMQLRWAMDLVMSDLKRGPKDTPPFGSNQWAIAPERSAENGPILCTDVHQTWEGPAVFHEARVHGGDLHMNGKFIVGSPLMGFGHNKHVGWAPTTGGPDVGDVLIMKIDTSKGPIPMYEYDGEWLPLDVNLVTINIKGADPMMLPVAWTKRGPVLPTEEAQQQMAEGYAYVGASPYFEDANLFGQVYEMCKAKTVDDIFHALRHHAFIQQNLMVADTEGNIAYARTGRTYIRPEGDYDWRAPVPGWTSETEYPGLVPVEDFVQIKNPEQGYMQNVNISPENMMVDSPLTPDKYPDYIFNVTWDFDNPRSRRIVPLLDADDSVTKEDAMAIAMDVYDVLAEPWQEALREAVGQMGSGKMEEETFAAAVNAVLEWDGNFTRDATATTLYKNWRIAADEEVDVEAIRDGKDLPMEDQIVLLDLLDRAIAEMVDTYGKWDVAWGDVHKVGRGGQLYGVGGADFAGNSDAPNMTETLFDVKTRPDKDNPGQFIAYSGSHHTMLMFMHPEGIESYSIQQWGNSGDPASPHYMDQGRELYSKRTMKPTWWDKEDLMDNVASEYTLTVE
jgi:acyl-homoserine lactone acylase PvdQ